MIGTITAVLTEAHVAYGWLTDAYKNKGEDMMSSFSSSCLFASYSRDKSKPYLDYAIVPVTEQFRQECEALMAPNVGATLNGIRFGRFNDTRSFWRNNYAGCRGHTPFIRGLETEEIKSTDTEGNSWVTKNKSSTSFAISGDSGARYRVCGRGR